MTYVSPKLPPAQQAAIKWWNTLPAGERTRLINEYGTGIVNCTLAYQAEALQARKELQTLLGDKK